MTFDANNPRIFLATLLLAFSIVGSLVLLPQQAFAQSEGCAALLAARITGTATGAAGGAAASAATAATGLPTHDAAAIATQVAVSHGQATQDTTKCVLDSLAWSVAKISIQSITRSTVNWINSGFQGSPAFVTDLQSNLQYLGDAVANNFFNNLNQETQNATGFNLKSPFQDQLSQQLRSQYYQATAYGLNQAGINTYDLNGHSTDPKAFIAGNFNQGGFGAFMSVSQNPANNPFGAYIQASNSLWSQVDTARQQRITELGWGKGFLPWRGNCASKTGSSATPLSTTDKCVGSPVKTPGSVIESQLENSLGTGIRQLELANSINQIVGALAGQLVSQVLGSGGLAGVSQASAGGGQSYLNQATSPTQYNTANTNIANGVLNDIQQDRTNASIYQGDWQQVLDSANTAQTVCGVRPDISTVITKAQANVSRGTQSLNQLNSIQAEVQSANTSSAANQNTLISAATTDYEAFIGSSVNPTADEQADASFQSSNTTNATPTSLYTQMVQAAQTCRGNAP